MNKGEPLAYFKQMSPALETSLGQRMHVLTILWAWDSVWIVIYIGERVKSSPITALSDYHEF